MRVGLVEEGRDAEQRWKGVSRKPECSNTGNRSKWPIPKRGSRASAAEGKGSTQVQAASDQTGIFFITQIYFITRSRSPSPRRLVLVCTERELIKTSRLQLWLYIRIMWELLKSPWANQIRFSWCGTQVFFKAPWWLQGEAKTVKSKSAHLQLYFYFYIFFMVRKTLIKTND